MAVEDTWRLRDGSPSARAGRGLRYRVRKRGHPTASFRTKREADVHWAALLAAPLRTTSMPVTVGELLDVWLDGKRGLSAKGREACSDAAARVRPAWGAMFVTDVDRAGVQAWIAGLAYQRRGESMPYSTSARTKTLQALSGAMRIAVERGLVEANPCRDVKVTGAPTRDPRFLTMAELRALADAVGPHWSGLVWLLGTTGLRVGEAVALEVGDVDAGRRRLRVRTSKTGRGRDVPVAASVLAMLDLGRSKSEPVFTSTRGGRVDVRSFRRRWFNPAAARLGLGCTIHDLRHTAASLAIASGADVKQVQAMLGHETARLTVDLYGHLLHDGLDDVAARIEGMMGD